MPDWFSKDAIHIESPEARDMQRNNDLRRMCFRHYIFNNALFLHSSHCPCHRLHKTVIILDMTFDAMG